MWVTGVGWFDKETNDERKRVKTRLNTKTISNILSRVKKRPNFFAVAPPFFFNSCQEDKTVRQGKGEPAAAWVRFRVRVWVRVRLG